MKPKRQPISEVENIALYEQKIFGKDVDDFLIS